MVEPGELDIYPIDNEIRFTREKNLVFCNIGFYIIYESFKMEENKMDCNCGYCVGGEPLAKFGIKI